nr:putative mitochondrial protein [Tanacetum cinerariifolium]
MEPATRTIASTSNNKDGGVNERLRQFIRLNGENVSWDVYKSGILQRFRTMYYDPISEIRKVKYQTNAKDYQDAFDKLLSRVDISKEHVVSFYLGRLPIEIKMGVRMFRPKTLADAYSLTNYEEATLKAVKKKSKTTITFAGGEELALKIRVILKKAKDLRPTLYDEKVIGLGYTPMFLTHSDEALEIEKFKRSRENKIEFAYDYGNLNASYVNEKINFKDDYFQDIINPDFVKIDSPFQQTSSLKLYVPNVILEKIKIDLEDEVVSFLEKEKTNLKTIESLKSKGFESSENVSFKSENQTENYCLMVEKEYDKEENPKVMAPGMMNDLLDDNNFFIFDDESVKISPVSKMPFREKPCDSMNAHSKSNMIKSSPRTVHKWFPKMQPLAEPVAKCVPRIVQISLWIIDSGCSKHMTGNRALLTNFVEKFLGMVRFGNNDFTVIAGYGDVVIGSM